MKNKGIIITLIIILSILVFSLILFLVEILNGSKNFKIRFWEFNNKSNQIIFDENYDIENINYIKVKQDYGDVKIEKTAEENIRVVAYGKKNNNIKVNVEENKLIIDYTEEGFYINFGIVKNDIIIYLPENYSNEIKIENNAGNCKIDDFENIKININSDAGNIELGTIYNATLKSDAGNINIDNILNKCEINSDCRKYNNK